MCGKYNRIIMLLIVQKKKLIKEMMFEVIVLDILIELSTHPNSILSL